MTCCSNASVSKSVNIEPLLAPAIRGVEVISAAQVAHLPGRHVYRSPCLWSYMASHQAVPPSSRDSWAVSLGISQIVSVGIGRHQSFGALQQVVHGRCSAPRFCLGIWGRWANLMSLQMLARLTDGRKALPCKPKNSTQSHGACMGYSTDKHAPSHNCRLWQPVSDANRQWLFCFVLRQRCRWSERRPSPQIGEWFAACKCSRCSRQMQNHT